MSNVIGLDAASIVSNLTSFTGLTGLTGKHGENGRAIAIYRGGATCQTLAGTFDEANPCFWTLYPLQCRDDDMGKDSLCTSQSFMPSAESITEDEGSSQANSFVKDTRPNARAWDDWRLTSRSFQPSPAFHLLKKCDCVTMESEATEKTGVSKPSFSPLELTKAFDEGTVSRLWAVEEGDEEEETWADTPEKSRRYHRRRGNKAETGDTIFSFFGLKETN
jgi:hypothetical protein